MAIKLNKHSQDISTERTPLWIDAWEYGRELFLKGNSPPWEDIAAFVAYHKKLQGLIKSDFVVVELECFYDNWLQRHPALLDAMSAKKRVGYSMRTLLADDASRNQIREIVDALADCYGDLPLVLSVPSPKNWLEISHCQAHGVDAVNINWEQAESGSMYMADYLRNFATCNLSGLLLKDTENEGPASDDELAHYQPVLNVAQHYRWQVVSDGCEMNYMPSAESGLTYFTNTQPQAEACLKFSLDSWPPTTPPPFNGLGFWYLTVQKGMVPESTLDALAAISAHGSKN